MNQRDRRKMLVSLAEHGSQLASDALRYIEWLEEKQRKVERKVLALTTFTPVCDCKNPIQEGGIGAWMEPDVNGDYVDRKELTAIFKR